MKKISYKNEVLEHFIPISLNELIDDLCSFEGLSDQNKLQFRQFCKCYSALYHAQIHQQYSIINDYLPFSPDRDSLSGKSYTPQEYSEYQQRLYKSTDSLLEKANYIALSENELNKALNKISPYGVEVSVNFEAFEDIKIYYRGVASHVGYKRQWRHLFLTKAPIEIDIYRRLFILLKPQSFQAQINKLQSEKKLSLEAAEKIIKKNSNLLPESLNGHTIFIKLFKDIPHSDLEMLFPNTQVKMRLFDKIKLAITGGGGTIGSIVATAGKIAATIDITTIAIALFGFVGVLWRQVSSIFTHRTKYMAALSQHLYYYNMDNNRGALAHIIELAEAEENKEAILSYFFLLQNGAMTSKTLDQKIESYIKQKYAVEMDFEVQDGLRKLTEYNLLTPNSLSLEDNLTIIPIESAITTLKQQWNKMI